MKPKTILIASGKGGTGKTTTSINFALALNMLNKKVLLIDGNIKKPNISHHFDMVNDINFSHVFNNTYHPGDIIKVHNSGLHIIMGSSRIEDLDHIDNNKFLMALAHLKEMNMHDFIIIDSAPNFSSEFFHSAAMSDEAIVVTKTDHVSIEDSKKTITFCEDEGAGVVGVIINAHGKEMKNIDKRKIEQELRKPILGIIPHDAFVDESLRIRHPVIYSFPNSDAALSFKEIGRKFAEFQ